MNSLSLTPQTARIIEAVSRLECIKPFVLVGGTALSIQLKTRQQALIRVSHIVKGSIT